MINEETIYMGNGLEGNTDKERAFKEVMSKAWKPVSIGSLTGIVIGTGAILATHIDMESGVEDDVLPADDKVNVQETPVAEQVVEPEENAPALRIASVDDALPFDEAFVSAREQVGAGGVFYWRGVIFSTYTADEWETMTEDQHESFSQQVRPEVEAKDITAEEIQSQIAQYNEPEPDVDDIVQDELLAADDVNEAVVADDVEVAADMAFEEIPIQEMNEDIAIDEASLDKINEDIAIAATPMYEENEDIAIADVTDEGVAIAELPDADPDVAIADAEDDVQDIAFAEDDDIRLAEMFSLQPSEEVAMNAAAATKGGNLDDVRAQDASFANFLSDDSVRIVGYGEFDGHVVRGLDLDGDDVVDIAVIDVDDSGDLSREDIIMEEGNGNQSTYGELQDFALNQMNDDNHPMTPNPDVADDMPDYMDDALAQL